MTSSLSLASWHAQATWCTHQHTDTTYTQTYPHTLTTAPHANCPVARATQKRPGPCNSLNVRYAVVIIIANTAKSIAVSRAVCCGGNMGGKAEYGILMPL